MFKEKYPFCMCHNFLKILLGLRYVFGTIVMVKFVGHLPYILPTQIWSPVFSIVPQGLPGIIHEQRIKSNPWGLPGMAPEIILSKFISI